MTRRPVSPAVAAALLGLGVSPHGIGPIARVRPARVIRTGAEAPRLTDLERAPTVSITYTRDDDTAAWYADLRAAQAVR